MGFLISDVFIFITLFFIKAYYGKFYNSKSLLPTINTKISWIIQEIPCVIVTLFYMLKLYSTSYQFIFSFPFLFHYIHRSLVFPFMITSSKNNPLEITIMAFTFCLLNAIMQNNSIIYMSYSESSINVWFISGVAIFLLGMFTNIFHDYYMMSLRKSSKNYIFPKGYLYNYITCPNYFGEIIEWIGYAIMCQNFSSLVFAVSTFANLFPRGISYYQWYKGKFKEEFRDKNIKAIIPYII